jgi:hypothetical protein
MLPLSLSLSMPLPTFFQSHDDIRPSFSGKIEEDEWCDIYSVVGGIVGE